MPTGSGRPRPSGTPIGCSTRSSASSAIPPTRRDGIPEDWIEAAQRSPVYALAVRHRVALPLHPEFRTLPMVWYVPPLSPVVNAVARRAADADPDDVFYAVDQMRIPLQYLANLLAAGDVEPVRAALRRLARS